MPTPLHALTARRLRTALQFALLGVLIGSVPARAEGREFHGSVGVGGYAALTGDAEYGLLVSGSVLPSQWSNWGLHGELRSFETGDDGWAALGLAFEAGAARPRLAINLYQVVGLTTDATPVIGAGIETVVGIVGPLAVGLDSSAHLVIDGTSDTQLVLAGALTLRLAR